MVHGPWTILNTGSTSHRRQAVPFACAKPWDAIVLPLSPLTPPWFLEVVFPYRWVPLPCCCFMLSFFPNWSYFDFWYSWMKMDERNRSFQWNNMAMENQTLEVVFEETPHPTCRMTIPSVFVGGVCVCVMLWKQSSETPSNTWNLEDFEHLHWFTKKMMVVQKIIPFLHSPFMKKTTEKKKGSSNGKTFVTVESKRQL